MNLYELSSDFEVLFAQYEDIINFEPDTDADGKPIDSAGSIIPDVARYKEDMLEAWYNTLEGIETEFELKAESLAAHVKSIDAEADALDREIKQLKLRKEQKERQSKNLKAYLLGCMERLHIDRVDRPKAKLTLQNNPESLIVDDELHFIDWAQKEHDECLKYSLPDIRKTETKKLINSGVNVPGVHIERSKSLRIR